MKTQIISELGDIVYFINPEADNLAFSCDMTLQMRGELVEIGEEDNLVRLLGEEEAPQKDQGE